MAESGCQSRLVDLSAFILTAPLDTFSLLMDSFPGPSPCVLLKCFSVWPSRGARTSSNSPGPLHTWSYRFFSLWGLGTQWECCLTAAAATAAKSLQSCPTLCDPMDCSLPGFSIHGIFQAKVLEWGAIAFSNSLLPTHNFFLTEIYWVYNVVLVSGVQQSDSVIRAYVCACVCLVAQSCRTLWTHGL